MCVLRAAHGTKNTRQTRSGRLTNVFLLNVKVSQKIIKQIIRCLARSREYLTNLQTHFPLSARTHLKKLEDQTKCTNQLNKVTFLQRHPLAGAVAFSKGYSHGPEAMQHTVAIRQPVLFT